MDQSIEYNVRIIDYINDKVVLTEWCTILPFLKRIKVKYESDPELLKVFSYLYFMTCESPKNPYFNYSLLDREFRILKDLECNFDIEDELILKALERLTEMYTLPSSVAYMVIGESLHKIASNLKNASSLDMDQTMIKSIMTAAANFKDLKKAFDETRKDLIIEETTKKERRIRGDSKAAYDD